MVKKEKKAWKRETQKFENLKAKTRFFGEIKSILKFCFDGKISGFILMATEDTSFNCHNKISSIKNLKHI